MRYVFRALFVMALMLSLAAQAGERHMEPDGGFSYVVPDNWRTMSYGGLKFQIIITDPVNNFSPNMTLVDEEYAGDLAAYEKANIPSMKAGIPGFEIISQTQGKTMNGAEYRSMRYYHRSQDIGTIIQTANFLKLRGNRKLVMTCTVPKGHEAKYEAICDKVVRSFRLE